MINNRLNRKLISLSGVVVLVLVMLLLMNMQFTSAAAEDFPRLLHLSWQNDPGTSMTVMWRSEPGAVGTVEYGKSSEYTESVESKTHSYKFARMEVCWHIAEITGLEPDTTYHYRVGTSEPWRSENYTFKTAPVRGDQQTSFRFAVLNDVQGSYETFERAAQKVKQENVDFILYLGDFTKSGSQPEYDRWFESGREIFNELPLMSVRGNVDGSSLYLDQFAFPGNERWFSIDYGNVHFVFLSTMTGAEAAEQRPWLINDLQENNNTWTIAMGHKPVFGSGSQNGPEQYLVDNWVDVFEEYGVDLYLNGHEHSYERSWPLKGGEINKDDGIIYITNGCAGDEFYPAVKTWLTARAEGSPCYMVLTVQGSQIKGVAKRLNDGSGLDKFELERP